MTTRKFLPKEDITTYELALAVNWMNTAMHAKMDATIETHWNELTDNVKRHFVEMEKDGDSWKIKGPAT